VEGLDRALLRIARRHAALPGAGAPDEAWERHLHELVGATWPCEARGEFEEILSDTRDLLRAQGLEVGRGAFGGWDDADPGFARAVWCLTVHLRPQTLVETGVAKGVTTRFILEALERSGSGHLWSIDRPPLDQSLHAQIGAAVPKHLRSRWTLLRGTSRRVLPGLLGRIGPIDLFVHDSLHTERNLRFELTRALGAMATAGALAADDVERNLAFEQFVEERPLLDSVIATADDAQSLFGVAVSRG